MYVVCPQTADIREQRAPEIYYREIVPVVRTTRLARSRSPNNTMSSIRVTKLYAYYKNFLISVHAHVHPGCLRIIFICYTSGLFSVCNQICSKDCCHSCRNILVHALSSKKKMAPFTGMFNLIIYPQLQIE